MFGFSNEFIFYCGIAITVVAFLGLVVWLCISKVRSVQIRLRLDSEYGPVDK